ncbi:phosphoglycerate kinase, partial [Enterobacter quasiroggenkampii]|nr:phosphoglycerate kinase [Enterobacter quasiroggenkampii]
GDAANNTKHPFVAILGGAMVSDKIGALGNLVPQARTILIGGGRSYTFYPTMRMRICKSLVVKGTFNLSTKIMDQAGDKLLLPVDSVVAPEFSNDAPHKVVEGDIPDGYMALDIGPKTIQEFKDALKGAKTVVWNGPMGVFEMSNYAEGTLE